MSKTALATKCLAMILAVGLSVPTVSGIASAEGELGQGGEFADPAYSTSPDNDWLSESYLSTITTMLNQRWADQSTDLTRLRASLVEQSLAEQEALMVEVDAEKQLAATRGAAELEIQAAQLQAAASLASGAVSVGASGTSRPKGSSPGPSTKGGTTDSSGSKSSGGSTPSP